MVNVSVAAWPLPWLGEAFEQGMRSRGHAQIIEGDAGLGQWELASALAAARLCENNPLPYLGKTMSMACGQCTACQLMSAGTHPDLMRLLPDHHALELGIQSADTEGEGGSDSKKPKKPSQELRVEAIRRLVSFSQTTSSRGRGKVVILFPADRMNMVASNTLLKTLEEPPGQAWFLLATEKPTRLLPTIRSRCHSLSIQLTRPQDALDWLSAQGVSGPDILFKATGGQVLEVLRWHRAGIRSEQWAQWPRNIVSGQGASLHEAMPDWIQSLQKLAHDLLCIVSGAPPRFFPADSLPNWKHGADPARSRNARQALSNWCQRLNKEAATAYHPWNPLLAQDALFLEARQLLVKLAS